ncbi:diguanylate cyclase [Quadrisphaera sp. INWT6]|uniref:GGDEF domain-containing protein n=1 Tax=Quadrisphaera sp. INWT6 TaxID=2596917 RepID=UPI001891FEE0|nr:GGDEF domain-containing protein [Quadrisphaera sp. INWT6]
MTSARPSLAAVQRWALLTAVGGWTSVLHGVHLLLVSLTRTPVHVAPVVASLVVWVAVTCWGLARRHRLTTGETALALGLGAVALTANGLLSGSPGHPYLISAALLALALAVVAFCGGWWMVLGSSTALACQLVLVLAQAGTGPFGLFVALSTTATTAGACLLIAGAQRDLHELADRAEEEAAHDPLTGLLNRRGMALALPRLRAQAPDGHRVAVSVFDLDHFKRVNDTHGHDAGDQVLVGVAAVLRERARHGDLVVRLGGEELAWIGTWASPQDARTAADQVRLAVAAASLPGGLRITTSAGVAFSTGATHTAPDVEALSRLLVRADAALYEAKHEGRDRVVLAPKHDPRHDPRHDPQHDGAPAPQVRDGGSGRAGAGAQRA